MSLQLIDADSVIYSKPEYIILCCRTLFFVMLESIKIVKNVNLSIVNIKK